MRTSLLGWLIHAAAGSFGVHSCIAVASRREAGREAQAGTEAPSAVRCGLEPAHPSRVEDFAGDVPPARARAQRSAARPAAPAPAHRRGQVRRQPGPLPRQGERLPQRRAVTAAVVLFLAMDAADVAGHRTHALRGVSVKNWKAFPRRASSSPTSTSSTARTHAASPPCCSPCS